MINFDWTSFTKKIAIKASLSDIYNAWTKASEIEKWFLKNADFIDENKTVVSKNSSALKGYSYEWRWHLYEDVAKGEIREANGKDFIQFTFEGPSLVDIILSEKDGYVLVELTQKEIPLDDHSKQYVRLGCASGWAFYLVNLKSVYEGGLDLRNKDARLSPMINN
jgi:uncharacterized protein YndB with AHSA1/START domain